MENQSTSENGGATAGFAADCRWNERFERGIPPPRQTDMDSLVFDDDGIVLIGLIVCCVAVSFGAGVWVGGRRRRQGASNKTRTKAVDSKRGRPLTDANVPNKILQGALQLLLDKNATTKSEKVVNFLDPDEMREKLFPSFSASEPLTLALSPAHQTHNVDQAANHFVALLQLVQRYSVDTSHRFFVNQLYGAVDPVALAADLVATSLNTSGATYEAGPVFTMLEHEVINHFGRLVYEPSKDEADHVLSDIPSADSNGEGKAGRPGKVDGMMVPGGSLSNLASVHVARSYWQRLNEMGPYQKESDSRTLSQPRLVALVSEEAHYSFAKAASVTGIGRENLIVVPTTPNGPLDVAALDRSLEELDGEECVPFYVGVTAGSTVRGSFDDIAGIVDVCRKHERRLAEAGGPWRSKIWVHVDAAWGGAALFSSRPQVRGLLRGVSRTDSLTYNPHKMLGAPLQTTAFVSRHEGVLRGAFSARAGYLFDPRKCGAALDIGDYFFTCGRRTDAIKFWALWKYYGRDGLGQRVDDKVDATRAFATAIQKHESFVLACRPWPFNVNFFYLPRRIRRLLQQRKISIREPLSCLPDDISDMLNKVSVELKRRLHQAGEMLVPYQPLTTQKAMCFRLVICGTKSFTNEDIELFLSTMEKYGADL